MEQVQQAVLNRRIHNAMTMRRDSPSPVCEVLHDDERLFDGAEMIIMHPIASGKHGSDETWNKGNQEDCRKGAFVPEPFESVGHILFFVRLGIEIFATPTKLLMSPRDSSARGLNTRSRTKSFRDDLVISKNPTTSS